MKTALIPTLLASSLVLAACAAPSAGSGNGGAAAAAGAHYCMRDRLETSGDDMTCNWAPTFTTACETNAVSTLKKSALAGAPANAGRCGNGQWLVRVNGK